MYGTYDYYIKLCYREKVLADFIFLVLKEIVDILVDLIIVFRRSNSSIAIPGYLNLVSSMQDFQYLSLMFQSSSYSSIVQHVG